MTKLENGLAELKEVWPKFENIVNDALMFKQVHGDRMSEDASDTFRKLVHALREIGVKE